MKEAGLNFIGNAEGRDIFNGNCHVVVCDGFIGNVVLKASESLAEMMRTLIREEITSTLPRKIGAFLAKGAFDDVKKRTDYAEYGGAPLLGVKGGCIISHGRSNAKAVKNAIRVANDFAKNGIDTKIRERISVLHRREHESAILVE
jgi:glycerol-3-phosphate acyltransferase PlsX